MAWFFKSNTARFRTLLLEDLPQEEDPIDAFSSLYRIVAELGFVSAIFAGVFIQRNGIIHQSSGAADIAKFVVSLAGAAGCGASFGCLYEDKFLAPRRWRMHRAQR